MYNLYQLKQFSDTLETGGSGKPTLSIVGGNLLINAVIKLTNNSGIDVPVTYVNGTVTANNQVVGKFTNKAGASVIARKRSSVSLPIQIDITGINAITSLVNAISTNVLIIDVRYAATVKPVLAFVLPIPITATSSFQIDGSGYIAAIKNIYQSIVKK